MVDRVINFSGGRTSAYMTKRLIDEFGSPKHFIITFQNTGKESPETLDFINECDKRWNLNVVWIEYRPNNKFAIVNYETASRNGEPYSYLIDHNKKFLPNLFARYCTDQLKIRTLNRYIKSEGIKNFVAYNGIRYDEPQRWAKAKNLPDYYDVEMPLIKWKVTKQDVLDWWSKQEFDLKIEEPLGNCDCCFLKGKNKLIEIYNQNPKAFDWWIEQEDKLNARFKKDYSYRDIARIAKENPNLFDGDVSFDCFCNID